MEIIMRTTFNRMDADFFRHQTVHEPNNKRNQPLYFRSIYSRTSPQVPKRGLHGKQKKGFTANLTMLELKR